MGAGGHLIRSFLRGLKVGQPLVNQSDGHRALADSRGDPFDRARMNVADGEDPGATGLEEQRLVAVEFREVLAPKVATGQKKPVVIGRQLTLEPFGVW